jgi:hypothetical protein
MIDKKINQSASSKQTSEYAINTQTHNPKLKPKTCEGIGCFLEASFSIKQNVGNFGIITLFLCDDCFAKFSDCIYCRQEIEKSDREVRWQAFEITGESHNCIRRKSK